jgi:hypothetical protein
MKDCLRCVEVTRFLQGTETPSMPVILSQYFPFQQKSQLVIHDQPSPFTSSYVLMCTCDSKKNEATFATRTKDYSPFKEKVDDQPPPSATAPNGHIHLE